MEEDNTEPAKQNEFLPGEPPNSGNPIYAKLTVPTEKHLLRNAVTASIFGICFLSCASSFGENCLGEKHYEEKRIQAKTKRSVILMPVACDDIFDATETRTRAKPSSLTMDSLRYFPPAISDFTDRWFKEQLVALKEPSIYHMNSKPTCSTYRFTWLRTRRHPIAIRIEKVGDTITLYAKSASGTGGYAPGKLIVDKVIPLDTESYANLKDYWDATYFWHEPTTVKEMGLDGAQWIFEARESDGRYHVVDRWCAQGTFQVLGMFMVQKAGLLPESDRDIY